jgi:hypothetical protein
LVLVSAVLLAVLGACGGDECGALVKVCNTDDGDTCACAPSCSTISDCTPFMLCHSNGSCEPCGSNKADARCACVNDICLPLKWNIGDSVSFKGSNAR